MKTTKPKAAAAASIGAGLAGRKRAELLEQVRLCFVRTGPWLQAGKYIDAVISGLPKRNGWTVAEFAGDRTPDRTQRLLNRASWDTFAAIREISRFAVTGLEEAARRGGRSGGLVIGAIDETGQEKVGEATAGVKRQYMGCAARHSGVITERVPRQEPLHREMPPQPDGGPLPYASPPGRQLEKQRDLKEVSEGKKHRFSRPLVQKFDRPKPEPDQ